MVERILAPGLNAQNPNLPWFHVTRYGRQVLNAAEYQPHDPTGYLSRLRDRVEKPDATVVVYLSEALEAFRRGTLVASMVMLGVAAERVFDLLCGSMEVALADPAEKQRFSKLLRGFHIKPRLDWLHDKMRTIQEARPAGFPENASLMITAIYDLMRCQRNDLGHPREIPPRLSIEDANANL